jgi:hypothetical protein
MAKITGAKEVQQALLNTKIKGYKGLKTGLKKAGLYLQRESMKLVPIQTGNLRGSADTQMSGSGKSVAATVSYATEYAVFVHENLEAKHGAAFNAAYAEEIAAGQVRWGVVVYYFKRGPKQQAKFLEQPLREKQKQLVQIVENELEQDLT